MLSLTACLTFTITSLQPLATRLVFFGQPDRFVFGRALVRIGGSATVRQHRCEAHRLARMSAD